MSNAKPVPLLGRLAVQMKLIDMEQLQTATGVQSRSDGDGKKLGKVLVDLGFINQAQLEKVEAVQRGVIAKHRARQAAQRAEGGPAAAPTTQQDREPLAPASPSRAVAPTSEDATAQSPASAQAASRSAAKPAPAASAAAPPRSAPQPVAAVAAATATPVAAEPTPVAAPPLQAAPPAAGPQVGSPATAEAPANEPGPAAQMASPAPDGKSDSLGLSAPASDADDRKRLHVLLQRAAQAGSSDIHIHSGAPTKVRINGVLAQTDSEILSAEDTERMVLAVLSDSERSELLRYGEVDACLNVHGVGRFRANVYRQQRGFDAVLRTIPSEPPTLEDLGLPSWIAKHTNYHQGMVLITGPAGCGKSATLAAMVNLINEERQDHILTIEDPIEVVHPSKRCLVNQRHAGRHTGSFARALRAALREDPDVIVIGELRDLETISLAMTAAETGHFVLATLHTNNAVRTINRMIGAFPSNQQGQVRTMLSESLRAVISQRLVPTADERGRVAALELLVINKAIGNMIRDEKTIQIRSSIQTGSAHGMMLLEQSLDALVREGKITREVALELAEEKKLITAE